MGKPRNLFSGTSGLNTVSDPVRISYDPETGVSDLAEAVNITIDQSGRPNRRRGFLKKQDGLFHSAFCDGGDCFCIQDREDNAAIMQIAQDFSLTGIRSGLPLERRVAFCQVGSQTFYLNGLQNGVIEDGVSRPWPVDEYVGVETDRVFSPAPVGEHFAWMNGRMFISEGKVVWWSELFKYGLFEKKKSFWQFHTKIRMIKPVASGLFISDEKNTWFYGFGNPNEPEILAKVADYPALEWSDSIEYVEGADIGLNSGLCALWSSTEGACLGTASGQFLNLTKEKIIYPKETRQGAGLLVGYNFIHTVR